MNEFFVKIHAHSNDVELQNGLANILEWNGIKVIIVGTYISFIDDNNIAEFVILNSSDINKIRENIIGTYSIILLKMDNIIAFTCTNAYHKLYYSYNENQFILSNSYVLVAQHLDKITLDVPSLLEQCFQYSMLENNTIFNEVKKVERNVRLNISKSTFKLTISQLPENNINTNSNSFEQNLYNIKTIIQSYGNLIADRYSNIALFMTGGLDSRLVLATYLSCGIKPHLYYGKGSGYVFETKDEDLEIVRQISEEFNLSFTQLDWSDCVEKTEELYIESNIKEYGDSFSILGGNKSILNQISAICQQHDFIDFGYFGEPFRNLDWIEPVTSKDIDDDFFLKNYQYYDIDEFLLGDFSFKDMLRKKISRLLNGYKELGVFKTDDYIKVHSLYRYEADTQMCNFVNQFGKSFSLLSIPDIHNYILSVPKQQKNKAKFQTNLIYSLAPELLNIPIFSHVKKWNINYNDMSLNQIKNAKSMRSWLVTFIPKALKNKIKKIIPPVNTNYHIQSELYVNKISILQDELKIKFIDIYAYNLNKKPLLRLYNNLVLFKLLQRTIISNEK